MSQYFAILPFIGALSSLSLGLFTLTRNPRNNTNIGFALGMGCLAIVEVGYIVIIYAEALSIAYYGVRISIFGESMLPVAWYMFSIAFAKNNITKYQRGKISILLVMLGLSSYFTLSAWLGNIVATTTGMTNIVSYSVGSQGRYYYIYMIISMSFSVAQLENIMRSASGTEKWKIKYIIIGVGAILVYFIYLASQSLLFNTISILLYPITSIAIIIVTAMMAIFIIKHRVMDADVFISRYIVYNSLAITIIGIYLFLVGIIASGINYYEIASKYQISTIVSFALILLLIIILFSSSVRRKAQLFINRNFYKHKYEFRDKWMESVSRFGALGSVDDTLTELSMMITETMGARSVEIWLVNYNHKTYKKAIDTNISGRNTINYDHPMLNMAKEIMRPFDINDELRSIASESDKNQIKELASQNEAVLFAPFLVNGEIIGFILLGSDISGENYGTDDYELVTALLAQVARQIKSIWLSQELIAAREMEAFNKISMFVIHDIKNLANSLSLVSHNAKSNISNPEFQMDAISTIENTVSKMKLLINKLSFDRSPSKYQSGVIYLDEILIKNIEEYENNSNKQIIYIKNISKPLKVFGDSEALNTVFTNIISNAIDSIQGNGEIKVSALKSNGKINIMISDSGLGMPREYLNNRLFQPFSSTKKMGMGIGLYQCKCIIEAHNGEIHISSEEGKGAEVQVILPENNR